MARENNTRYALLGLLSFKPMTGYEIRRLVQESIGHFWHESYGQIYPALAGLHKAGLVSRKVRKRAGKPERHEYSISAKGRRHLVEWLAREPQPERIRHELLLKLHFAAAGNLADHLRNVETYGERQRALLKQFEWIKTEYFRSLQDDPSLPFWEAELAYGFHIARARLAWAEETLQSLKKLNRTGRR